MARDLFSSKVSRELRDYQKSALGRLHASILRGHRKVVLQLPTGAGKTLLAAEFICSPVQNGRPVLFTTPSISLVDQTVRTFEEAGIFDIGVMQSGHPRTDPCAPVQIATLQTLARRPHPVADIVVVDEAHIRSEAILALERQLPHAFLLGLTATPWRRGMGNEWEHLIIGATVEQLIERGHLSDFRVFATGHPDLSGVKIAAGDYHKGQLSSAMSDAKLVGDIVMTWLERGENRPTILFAVDRAHAKFLQGRFEDAGVPTGYVDAGTERTERAKVQRQLECGKFRVVVNVACLTTGVDWDIRCIILARPTKSEMLYVQMLGRGLRTTKGKSDLLVLDHSDNTERLGFVTEVGYDRLLDGTSKAAGVRRAAKPKPCRQCGYVMLPRRRVCPSCGYEVRRPTGGIATADRDLQEVRRTKSVSKPDPQVWYSQLLFIARHRKRSSGWAAHVFRAKFGRWPNGLKWVLETPTPEVLNFVKAQDIRYVKRRRSGNAR